MKLSTSLTLPLIGMLGAACDDQPRQIQIVENVAPFAAIRSPTDVGRGDLVPFDGRESRDADGRITGYDWDFGDGTAHATEPEAFHTYNEVGMYVVRLIVTDDRGATGTSTAAITVMALPDNQPPIARIQAPTRGMPRVPVALDATQSSDPDGTIISYSWRLDSAGTMATGTQVSHTYVDPGSYEITLTVTDNRGAQSTATHVVEIGMQQGNLPPVANAGADRSATLGAPVSLDGSMSYDPDGTIASFAWDFGDGSMGTGATAMHTYNVGTSFLVRLTVTDAGGLTGTDTATITVGQGNYDGLYSMVANPAMQNCSIAPATFVATSIRYTTMNGMLVGETPNPENPNGPPIRLMGSLAGATFSISGIFDDTQGGHHDINLAGMFTADRYSATMTETVSISGFMLCTLTWNLSGDRLE